MIPLPDDSATVREQFRQSATDQEECRQNRLLAGDEFEGFARRCGVPAFNVKCDVSHLHRKGWIEADDFDSNGSPFFHPFRLYPIHLVLRSCRVPVSTSAPPERGRTLELVSRGLNDVPSESEIAERAAHWNVVADLAILLEPLYWPYITGQIIGMDSATFDSCLEPYRRTMFSLLSRLSLNEWEKSHRDIRQEAHSLDGNGQLYLLLRISHWRERQELTGRIAGALWLRHLAEVIRRGFEEVHGVKWCEEDRAYGQWIPGGRKQLYGAERPLDDAMRAKPYLAYRFGLFTGSPVRWYVEGPTEYFAIREILGNEPERYGIGLQDLRGTIRDGKANIALKLQDSLLEDKALRRFSVISFDTDVAENVKAIRQQARQGNIVGMIAPHDPDFEFANFEITELVEVAASMDEAHEFSGDDVRSADWTGIAKGKAFEAKYLKVSLRKAGSLKGEEWGRALGRWAASHPKMNDGSNRPVIEQVSGALHAWNSNYDREKDMFRFDPETFKKERR